MRPPPIELHEILFADRPQQAHPAANPERLGKAQQAMRALAHSLDQDQVDVRPIGKGNGKGADGAFVVFVGGILADGEDERRACPEIKCGQPRIVALRRAKIG